MPDLKNFAITPQAAASVNVPRATISCQVVDSQTGDLIADLTGVNAVQFPGVLTTLTAQQRLAFAHMVANWLVRVVAGIDPGTL